MNDKYGRRDGASSEVDRVARLMIAEWERVEHEPVNVSRIATFADMARVVVADRDRLAAEVERLKTRQQELLATIVKVTNETPFSDEAQDALRQRGALVAEIGTLKSQRDTALRDLESARAEVGRMRAIEESAVAWRSTPIRCREDAHARDEAFAEVVERLCRDALTTASKKPADDDKRGGK